MIVTGSLFLPEIIASSGWRAQFFFGDFTILLVISSQSIARCGGSDGKPAATQPKALSQTGGAAMIRGLLVLVGSVVFASMVANGQMVSNSAIQNDPAKEALCAKRAKVKPVPFLIDQNYVNSARAAHQDATFIAEDGTIPELIECRINETTGLFELDSQSSEQSKYWHLVRPEQFAPGIHLAAGQLQADDVCFKAAREKVNQEGFDHSFGYTTDVNEITLNVAPWYQPGAKVAGMKAERYDIAVAGKLFYKSSGPDLTAFRVSCLLSPKLEVKAVQASEENVDRALKMETRFEAPFRK
jgi:hypothetical protein